MFFVFHDVECIVVEICTVYVFKSDVMLRVCVNVYIREAIS